MLSTITPVGRQRDRCFGVQIREIGRAVPIKGMFEVAVGGTSSVRSIALVSLGEVNAIGVLKSKPERRSFSTPRSPQKSGRSSFFGAIIIE